MKKMTSLLVTVLALISAPAFAATSLAPDCSSEPNFAAAIGSATSATTFVSAIVPVSATVLGVYTYTPGTLAHAGPYYWSVDATGTVQATGPGWGSPTSTAPVTAIVFAPLSATAATMTVNGVAGALSFQGMVVPGATALSWGGGMTAIDSSGPQTMVFAGYNGAAGGSSSGAVAAYGVCSGVTVGFSNSTPAVGVTTECTFTAGVGPGTASEFEFEVDGTLVGQGSGSSTLTIPCNNFSIGTHALTAIATDSAGHTVVSAPLGITIPAPAGCLMNARHHCI